MLQHCHNRHVLSLGASNPHLESKSRFCDICLKNILEYSSSLKHMSCSACDIDVCHACISRHCNKENMDTGLMIILRRKKSWMDQRMTLYDVYKQQPKFGQELFRNPDAAGIYWEVQKFNYTQRYEDMLRREVDGAREEFNVAEAKLGKAQNALEEFKYERERIARAEKVEKPDMDVEDCTSAKRQLSMDVDFENDANKKYKDEI